MTNFETLLKDAIASCKRLNDELAERIKFEESLIKIINEKDKEISELKEKLAIQNEEEAPLKEYLNDIDSSIEQYKTVGKL